VLVIAAVQFFDISNALPRQIVTTSGVWEMNKNKIIRESFQGTAGGGWFPVKTDHDHNRTVRGRLVHNR